MLAGQSTLTPAQTQLAGVLQPQNPGMDALAAQVQARDAARFGSDADQGMVARMGPGLLARAQQMGGTDPALDPTRNVALQTPAPSDAPPVSATAPDIGSGTASGGVGGGFGTLPEISVAADAPPLPPVRPDDLGGDVGGDDAGGGGFGELATMAGGGAGPDMPAATATSPGVILPPMAGGGTGPDMPGATAASPGALPPATPDQPNKWPGLFAGGASDIAKAAGLFGKPQQQKAAGGGPSFGGSSAPPGSPGGSAPSSSTTPALP